MNRVERFLSIISIAVIASVVGASVTVLVERDERTLLHVTTIDVATGEPTPVRVKLTDSQGYAAGLPEQAIGIMYGMWDHADGFAYQPDSSFYVDGMFEITLDPGTYVVSISKGNEFMEIRDTLNVEANTALEYRLERWINTAETGWYSADDHIHIRRSPRENPLLLDWIQAEDIRVGNTLRMGDFWAKYYSQYAFGAEGAYREGDFMLVSGQEDPRTPEIGHLIGLGASKFVRFPNRYYLYDLVLDSLHALGGIGGYAHQAETFHGYRGLTLDGLRGKVDMLEVVQFCAPGGPLITDHYYYLLNLGFPVTATAGSDFPWCGLPHDGSGEIPVHENARIGNARFYAHVDGELTYDSWMDAVRAGRTFASSGPVLLLEVNGRMPGSSVDLTAGADIRITATAYGHEQQVPLSTLEVIRHGDVITSVASGDEGQSPQRMVIELDLIAGEGMWIAARAAAGPMQVAHTTPVYVMVDGDGFHSDVALDSLLGRSEEYLLDLEHILSEPHDHVEHQAWRYREGLMQRIDSTRRVIERMRRRE
jgi:hypothetical protein